MGGDVNKDVPAAKEKVGFLLGIGILLVPFIFVWFLLKRGYSNFARIVGFGWLAVFFIAALNADQSSESVSARTSSSGANASRALDGSEQQVEKDRPVETTLEVGATEQPSQADLILVFPA
jgi:hypothetical protein